MNIIILLYPEPLRLQWRAPASRLVKQARPQWRESTWLGEIIIL